MPFFIKSKEMNYIEAYKNFVKKKPFTQNFLISPSPTNFSDIIMNQNKIDFFFENIVKKSEKYFQIFPLFLNERKENETEINEEKEKNKFEVNNFLSPLLFSYNNNHLNIPVTIGGFPNLKYINYLAQIIEMEKIHKVKNLFQNKVEDNKKVFFNFFEENKPFFSILQNKYSKKILQNLAFSNKTVIAVVDHKNINHLENDLLSEKEIFSDKFSNLEDLINIDQSLNIEVSFLEYFEKLAFFDFFYGGFTRKYFFKENIFPFKIPKNIEDLEMIYMFNNVLFGHYLTLFGDKCGFNMNDVKNEMRGEDKLTEFEREKYFDNNRKEIDSKGNIIETTGSNL